MRASRAALAIALSLLVGACGSDEAPDVVAEGEASTAPVFVPPVRGGDLQPPLFSGLQRIELIGAQQVRLQWDPATDDTTPPEQITYEVHFAAEAWRVPQDNSEPFYRTDPGVTSIDATVDRGGRWFVRAVDAAGRKSVLNAPLYQRSERPIVSALDGRPFAHITTCDDFEPGRAVCVGPDGFAARWDRDRWTNLEMPDGVDWRLARRGEELFLYSEVGHLYRFLPNDPPEPLDVRFDSPEPLTPFSQFVVDPLGLQYWVDSQGVVFVGVPGDFRRMTSPLALPAGEGCTTVRLLMFADNAGFAVCPDGAVYSTRYDQDGLRWMPLTVNTPEDVLAGALNLIARDDTGAIVVHPDGVRRVGVGGWQPIVLVGRPLDPAQTDSTMVTHVGQVSSWGEELAVATSAGLLRGPDGFLEPVAGADGNLSGFVRPTPIEPRDTLRLIWEDSSVVLLQGGRRTWEVRPQLTGFITGTITSQGVLVAATPDTVFRMTDGSWVEMGPPPAQGDPALRLQFVAEDADGTGLLAGGESSQGPFFVRRSAGGWASETLSVRDAEGEARAAETAAEARERLIARGETPAEPTLAAMLARTPAGDDRPALLRPIDIDTASDGRGILVTDHDVYWRMGSSWMLLTRREGTINAVALDGGEGYVLIEDGLPLRCVREFCEEGVQEAANSPLGLRSTWRTPQGLAGMLGDGSVVRFVAAPVPEGPIVSVLDVPAGAWEAVLEPSPATLPNGNVRGRFQAGGEDLLWLTDGQLYGLESEQWILQGSIPDGHAFWSEGERWGILGAQGLLTLLPVSDATP